MFCDWLLNWLLLMLMLMLMLARKMPAVQDSIRAGHIPYKKLTGFTLHGKTLGVLGTGKIGMSVVAIAKAMGMHVIAHDPFPNHELAEKYSFSYVPAHELFKGADVITLHTADIYGISRDIAASCNEVISVSPQEVNKRVIDLVQAALAVNS